MKEGRFESPHERPSFRFLDLGSEEIRDALSEAPLYRKQTIVHARRAQEGTSVSTVLPSGFHEKDAQAGSHDWIVTNPHGEEYLVPGDEFLKKYEQTDEEGTYRSRGFCRAIANPTGVPIEVEDGSGQTMRGDGHCFVVHACTAEGTLYGEPYLVAKESFEDTYCLD